MDGADTLVGPDDRKAAHYAYYEALAIRKKLVAAKPGNLRWQRDLSISYDRIGSILAASSDYKAALAPYRKAFAIAKKLVAANPGDVERQRDLFVSQSRIADMQTRDGNHEAAFVAYRKAIVILGQLVDAKPGDARWQRDFAVTWEKIGDLKIATGDHEVALVAYNKAVVLFRQLAAYNPGHADDRLRSLAVGLGKVGDSRVATGDREAAFVAYYEALAIAEKLVADDPGNARWQGDLAAFHGKIGDMMAGGGDHTAAGEAYSKALTITEELVVADPDGNAEWQRYLALFLQKIREIERNQEVAPKRPGINQRKKGELVSRETDYTGGKGENTSPAEARGLPAPGDLSGTNVSTDVEKNKSYTTEEAALLLGPLPPNLTSRSYKKAQEPLPEVLRLAAASVTSKASRNRKKGIPPATTEERQLITVAERLMKRDRAARKKLANPQPGG